MQALLIGGCVTATHVVRRIPKSVLWGYFAHMSLESLPGSEFWERALLLLTDRHKRFAPMRAYMLCL
jgi:boron transporter